MFLRLCSLPWHRLEKQVFGGEEEWDIGCEGAWLGERLDLCLSRVLYSPKPAGTDALCLQLLGRSLNMSPLSFTRSEDFTRLGPCSLVYPLVPVC